MNTRVEYVQECWKFNENKLYMIIKKVVLYVLFNMTDLQPVSRPVKQVYYIFLWGVEESLWYQGCADRQTKRPTDRQDWWHLKHFVGFRKPFGSQASIIKNKHRFKSEVFTKNFAQKKLNHVLKNLGEKKRNKSFNKFW